MTDSLIGGRYALKRLIGEGSFARVYLAEQTSVGRKVAVKILNRDLEPAWDAVSRFQEEARLLARVKSPSIVELYDIGRTETGDPYIVMEYVDGRTLGEVLKAVKRLDAARGIHILLQIAAALSVVHAEGVIHRDLKPGNIVLVRGHAGRERVKILDFGLAKVVGASRERGDRVTQQGLIAGTPQFMAPEQAHGSEVDARTDLFALGCVAYQVLTGQPPFAGSSDDSTMQRRLNEDARPLRQVCPHAGIPESLERVVLRMLARNPADRFDTADDLHSALVAVALQEGMSPRELADTHLDDGISLGRATGAARAIGGKGDNDESERRPLRRRELILIACTLFVVGLAGGVLLDRWLTLAGP